MRFFLAFLGLNVMAMLGILLNRSSQSTPSASVHQQLAHNSNGLTPIEIHASGRIEGLTREVHLRTSVRERVADVFVQEGQQVKTDDILLQLNERAYRAEVDVANAELEVARARHERLVNGASDEERKEASALFRAKVAELEQAQMSWTRTKKLRLKAVVPQQLADDQESLVKSLTAEARAAEARAELLHAPSREDDIRIARAQIEVARAKLQVANERLARTRLIAPFGGLILKCDVNRGEMTGPDSTEPPVILADTSGFRVRAFVEELDAPRLRVGMQARVFADGLPGHPLTGRIAILSPRMSRKEITSDSPTERLDTKMREVWIELDQVESLVVGLRVDVIIRADS